METIKNEKNRQDESRSKVLEIGNKYLEMCLRCNECPDTFSAFKQYTREFLTTGYTGTKNDGTPLKWSGCGMQLPKSVDIQISYIGSSYPKIFIIKKDGNIENNTNEICYTETYDALISNNSDQKASISTDKGDDKYYKIFDGKPEDYVILLIIPNIISTDDVLLDITFKEDKNTQIIVTTT